MKQSHLLATALLAAVPLGIGSAAQAAPVAAQVPAQAPAVVAPAAVSEEGAVYARTIFQELNKLRAEQGLQPLTRYAELDKVSQDWSEQMVVNKEMKHNPNSDGQYPAGWKRITENVAMRAGDDAGTDIGKALFEQWKNSPDHYENMIDPSVNSVGIGIAYDEEAGAWYATQNFANYPDAVRATLTPTDGAAQPQPADPQPVEPEPEQPQPADPQPAEPEQPEPAQPEPAQPEQPEPAEPAQPADPAQQAQPGADAAAPGGAEKPADQQVPVVTPPAAQAQPAKGGALPTTGTNVVVALLAVAAVGAGAGVLYLRRRARD